RGPRLKGYRRGTTTRSSPARAEMAEGAASDAAPPDVPRAAVQAPSDPCSVSSEPDRVGAGPSQPLSCTPAPDPSWFGPAQIQPDRSIADKPLPRTDFCSTSARPTSSHVSRDRCRASAPVIVVVVFSPRPAGDAAWTRDARYITYVRRGTRAAARTGPRRPSPPRSPPAAAALGPDGYDGRPDPRRTGT